MKALRYIGYPKSLRSKQLYHHSSLKVNENFILIIIGDLKTMQMFDLGIDYG